MNFILRLIISTFGIVIAERILPGVHINSILTAIIVAVVLAFLNSVIKPIMIMLTIPVTLVTFGLFLVVINALLILMASALVDGFVVDGFLWALIFSIVLSMITSILNTFTGQTQNKEE